MFSLSEKLFPLEAKFAEIATASKINNEEELDILCLKLSQFAPEVMLFQHLLPLTDNKLSEIIGKQLHVYSPSANKKPNVEVKNVRLQ